MKMKLHRSIPLFLLAAALLALSAPFEASAWRGVQKWSYDAGNSVTGSPAAVNGTIVIGDSEGRLVALDKATGELRWTFSAGGTINGTPALLGSTLFTGGADGSLFAVDGATGREVWHFTPREKYTPGAIWSSPAAGNGRVYFNSADGKV
ncbi:MAG TPA: PQQ-binding-like beta-propeller repeat protein, partial [Aminivibrio sp.]|nr:PQQ-binding-like beta-propeller repeat protein [Aminivibrio sp.]